MSNALLLNEINSAIQAHGRWKLKLSVAIDTGHCDMTPGQVRCDDCCDFGKWIHGASISASVQDGMPYQVIKRLHAEFHKCAGNVLQKAVDRDTVSARALLNGVFTEQSHTLIVALNKWKRELTMDEAA